MIVESKEYSWAWVTAGRRLSHGPCELLFAYLVPSTGEGDVTLYDGESTSGDQIVELEATVTPEGIFKPPVSIYCRRGLYVDVGSNVTGIFVQWRELR